MSGDKNSSMGGTWTTVLATSAATAALIFGYLQLTKKGRASTSSIEHDKPLEQRAYEQKKMIDEYLMMHFGENSIGVFDMPDKATAYSHGAPNQEMFGNYFVTNVNATHSHASHAAPKYPSEALNFPKRVADMGIYYFKQQNSQRDVQGLRAFDCGCAVGRTAFELASFFPDVLGLDYSYAFVDACKALAESGQCSFAVPVEGEITFQASATVDASIDRTRCTFIQGDGCNLDPGSHGTFDCVTAANLIDRLPKPIAFLSAMKSMVKKNGVLVITSPYTWLEQYTDKADWIGGRLDKDGNPLTTFEGLKAILAPEFVLIHQCHMPFIIRETARKNQFTMAHCTVWFRK